jgi:hypothetical protein
MSDQPPAAEWAVVTGASSGLGADFARQLAARGYDVVLAARRVERLEAVAAEIRAATGRQAAVVALDLTETGSPERLFDAAAANDRIVSVLVNNAGFGQFGQFLNRDPAEELDLLTLNIATPVALTRLFGRPMARRRHGHILQVGSMAGFQPTPWYAVYGASKAFLQCFGEALHVEMARKGVVVTVLSPGMTDTEFFQVSGHDLALAGKPPKMMASTEVVRAGLEGLFAGKAAVVPRLRNRLVLFAERFAPRRTVAAVAGRINKGGRR